MYLSNLALVSLVGFVALAAIAAFRDIRTMTIPNSLILALLACYLCVAAAAGWTREEITTSLIAAAMVLFAGLLLNTLGWLSETGGSAIAKYAAVCCLWLGAPQVLNLLFLSALITAGFALLIVCLPVCLPKGWQNRVSGSKPENSRRYGFGGYAVAAAAVLLLPASPWVSSVI
ncbi:prepilin peptidase [Thalassobius sp. Cn5-15]|uniref:A24 family peptidase n=1 Tax=Thalassobius sp. Cn5-15 TaxID=2917763 RepID=UPI001EF16731|nr:prepilin peptidase [Thalassobius sp. Cn5-15]MCG7492570.1 prepilin peptidase [Thalassobius sp. Cn5-15]